MAVAHALITPKPASRPGTELNRAEVKQCIKQCLFLCLDFNFVVPLSTLRLQSCRTSTARAVVDTFKYRRCTCITQTYCETSLTRSWPANPFPGQSNWSTGRQHDDAIVDHECAAWREPSALPSVHCNSVCVTNCADHKCAANL